MSDLQYHWNLKLIAITIFRGVFRPRTWPVVVHLPLHFIHCTLYHAILSIRQFDGLDNWFHVFHRVRESYFLGSYHETKEKHTFYLDFYLLFPFLIFLQCNRHRTNNKLNARHPVNFHGTIFYKKTKKLNTLSS